MKNETRVEMLKNRIAILEARKKDNTNVIKAIKREIRTLGGN